MSGENQKDWKYIEEGDQIQNPDFAQSNKAGYVEDGVDVWVKEVRAKYTDLANNFNELVYLNGLSSTELKEAQTQISNLTEANQRLLSNKGGATTEEIAQFETDIQAVRDQYNELLENYEEIHARNLELEKEAAASTSSSVQPQVVSSHDRPLAHEDGYTYFLEYTDAGNVATVREFPNLSATGKNAEHALSELMDKVDEEILALTNAGEAVPEPGVYERETVGGNLDQTKITAILDAAATEAAEHVKRTQEQMLRLEEAARREAASIVEEAHRDAEESREEAKRNREESAAIRSRMTLLLESQLSEIRNNENSVGYNPVVSAHGRGNDS